MNLERGFTLHDTFVTVSYVIAGLLSLVGVLTLGVAQRSRLVAIMPLFGFVAFAAVLRWTLDHGHLLSVVYAILAWFLSQMVLFLVFFWIEILLQQKGPRRWPSM